MNASLMLEKSIRKAIRKGRAAAAKIKNAGELRTDIVEILVGKSYTIERKAQWVDESIRKAVIEEGMADFFRTTYGYGISFHAKSDKNPSKAAVDAATRSLLQDGIEARARYLDEE